MHGCFNPEIAQVVQEVYTDDITVREAATRIDDETVDALSASYICTAAARSIPDATVGELRRSLSYATRVTLRPDALIGPSSPLTNDSIGVWLPRS